MQNVIVVYYSGNPDLEKFKADNEALLRHLKIIYAHNPDFGGIRLEVMPVEL